jgi:hypothetical protein
MAKHRNARAGGCSDGRDCFSRQIDNLKIAENQSDSNIGLSTSVLHDLLEVSPYENDGDNIIGRDPRTLTVDEWQGNTAFLTGLKAIRANCLSCNGSTGEVRKCIATGCVFWPLRMGQVPKGFREGKEAHYRASRAVNPEDGPAQANAAYMAVLAGQVSND